MESSKNLPIRPLTFDNLETIGTATAGEKRKLPVDVTLRIDATEVKNGFRVSQTGISIDHLGFAQFEQTKNSPNNNLDIGFVAVPTGNGGFIVDNRTANNRTIWSGGEKIVVKSGETGIAVSGSFKMYTDNPEVVVSIGQDLGKNILVKQTRIDLLQSDKGEKPYRGGLKMANVLDGLPYNPFSEFKRKTGASVSNVEIIIGGSPDLEQKPNEFAIAFADNKGVPLREKYSQRELKLAMKGGRLQITNLSNGHFATFNEDSPAGRVYDGKVDPQGTIELQDNQIIKLKIRDIDYIVKTGSLKKNPPEVYITSTTSKK